MKARVYHFPSSKASAPAVRRHDTIRVRVLDERRPKRTRWATQFGIQRAAGFSGVAGFTDHVARQGAWHSFQVRPQRTTRFLRDVDELIDDELIEVRVNGKRVQAPGIRRRA